MHVYALVVLIFILTGAALFLFLKRNKRIQELLQELFEQEPPPVEAEDLIAKRAKLRKEAEVMCEEKRKSIEQAKEELKAVGDVFVIDEEFKERKIREKVKKEYADCPEPEPGESNPIRDAVEGLECSDKEE
jgi:hypothetical protein